MNLIEKIDNYLDEAHGRGMMKPVHVKDKKKLEALLKKKGIKYSIIKGDVYVGDSDEDDVEELAARNNLY